ncbi:flagellar hook-length control protein FliK [Quatrionicoccus australiensis]|uniref:flagellar hook-length control protein FliK n=1 Tax=Quatrionicoccus australiensis TaxID=138118 RepID=UPI001CFACAA0|nr:flagellar hook-length control protein FliK [Quatrionicoccus australiensis]MCB4360892.1 flagellar hook-length control protein FliK [Quatrionicoccus australiensis]
MIPADIASHLRLAVPDQPSAPQPVTPVKNLGDVLSDLVPGQRIMAEIQAMLPNGTYRAVVAQRDITLALPFAAKQGDSLELEVVENDGKLALAVVSNRTSGAQAGTTQDSVATTLSQTGKLIGDLLADIDGQGKRAAPAPLNGNQPLVEKFPASAADLAPLLKDALSKSGVFYEAHQARWVAGQLPTEQLLQEPQGKHSSPEAALNTAASQTANGDKPLVESKPSPTPTSTASDAISIGNKSQSTGIPSDLTPLVQQQLESLATQTFAWQGQVWPGQQMHWEIDEQSENATRSDRETSGQWQTRLKLNLPQLGGIDATLSLRPGNEVEIALSATSDNSEAALSSAANSLRQQFEAAGLNLTKLSIKHGTLTE